MRRLWSIDREANQFLVTRSFEGRPKNLSGLGRRLGQQLLLAALIECNDFHPLRRAAPRGPAEPLAREDEFMGRLYGPQCDRFDANGVVFKTPGQPAASGADGHGGRCNVWPEELSGLSAGVGVLVIDARAEE